MGRLRNSNVEQGVFEYVTKQILYSLSENKQ